MIYDKNERQDAIYEYRSDKSARRMQKNKYIKKIYIDKARKICDSYHSS
jgi:hypothetical protein